MNRYLFIDTARGIAILLVVYGHVLSVMNPDYYYMEYIGFSKAVVFALVMPFFFMISGVFLRKRLESDNFSERSFLNKIINSILKPFYSLSLVFFTINIIAPKSMNLPSAKEMITALAVMQGKGVSMPSGVLWFLFVLFVFSLVTYFFIRVIKVHIYIILVFSIIILFVASLFEHNYYFAINKITSFYFYFIAGYILSEHITTGKIFRNNLLSVYFVFFIIPLYIEHHVSNTYIVWAMEYTGIKSLAGSLLLTGLCYKIQNISSSNSIINFLRFSGEYSMIIYVFHAPTMFIMHKIVSHIGLTNSVYGLFFIVLTSSFFPLVYGKILSYNAGCYRLLLGRSP